VDIGEAIPSGAVDVGVLIAISVWVGLTCKVIVATEPTGFWSVIWVGEPDLPGRLQAERTAASERDIDRSLNAFNFAFYDHNEDLIRYNPISMSLVNCDD